jgi:hypothetical protein
MVAGKLQGSCQALRAEGPNAQGMSPIALSLSSKI